MRSSISGAESDRKRTTGYFFFLNIPYSSSAPELIGGMTMNVTFRRRQHEISKVDRTVFSDVGVASENGK
ncbi:resolvase, N terminal domain protein [Pseudomonas putida ND6]|uniref:Resolvase, N terminal domain protein n=1 Tax=Pseudomonas putida ND6 TaxID=231023 RepID=I3UT20_PSEPU|nr:resolvase, N terminal domain protein [Pseudomonas putida ND6]